MENPKVAVLILNYQSFKDTIDYVQNLKKQKNIDLFILVVDNCSPNDSFNILKNEFSKKDYKEIEIIKTERNGGYAYGNNFGLNVLRNKAVDYIIISNNDIHLDDEYLISHLTCEYSKCENAAFASPIMKVNGKEAKFSAWKLPTVMDDIKDSLFILKLLTNQNISYKFSLNDKGNKIVDCLPGSFFIGRKDIFFKIGLFDENTFLYAEERILSFKAKSAGFKNYLIRSLEYNHRESGSISSSIKRLKMQKYLVESRKYFHKTYSRPGKIFIHLLEVLHQIWKFEALIYYKIIKKK